MDLGLTNKTVLVVAASQGLGKAVAECFTAEGAKVFTCSRHTPIQCDLTNPEQIRQLLETTGPVDILVTNAGGPKPGTFSAIGDADWEATFQLTFMSAVRLIRGVLPHMQQQHWGRIICLTSTSVKQPLDNLIASNAIRAAVTNLAKTLANEVGPDGITVNAVAPGMFETDRLQHLIQARADASGYMFDEEKDILRRTIPVRRFGNVAELAATVVFLASEPGGYINGVSLAVDGGLTKSV